MASSPYVLNKSDAEALARRGGHKKTPAYMIPGSSSLSNPSTPTSNTPSTGTTTTTTEDSHEHSHHQINVVKKVAGFSAKLRHQATETKRGNRGVIELARRHQMKSKKDMAREKKIENLDNTRQQYIIDPDHFAKQCWDVTVLLLVVINLFTIPISMASQFEQEESLFFSTTVDTLFIMDLFFTFFTGYNLTNGERIWNHKMIVENYIYSGWFFIDFVACVPWEIFAKAVSGGASSDGDGNDALKYTLLVRALKLPRLLRLGKVFKYLNRFKYAQAWKIIRLLMIMIIAAHWIGCLFFFVCELQMDTQMSGGEPWCFENQDVQQASGSGRILIAFHTAFLMLVGEGIGPTTLIEYAYTVVALIIGQIISAVVIGNISIVLNNQASMSALYTQKMDRVNESMMTLKLPIGLQHKVRTFYEYMWNRHRVLAGNETFRFDLNDSLRSEVDLYLNRDIVVANSMFSKVSDSVLIAIVVSLKNQVYLEHDYIIRKGQFGSEMYFLLHGKAGARINNKIVKSYSSGDSFGEVALIADGGRRKCDVIALTNVDLRLLMRCDYDVLCANYPELKSRLREEANSYSKNAKAKSRFKSATTVLAKKGIAGLFSTKTSPDGPMNTKTSDGTTSPTGLGSLFGKKIGQQFRSPKTQPAALGTTAAAAGTVANVAGVAPTANISHQQNSTVADTGQSTYTKAREKTTTQREQREQREQKEKEEIIKQRKFTITATPSDMRSSGFHDQMKAFASLNGISEDENEEDKEDNNQVDNTQQRFSSVTTGWQRAAMQEQKKTINNLSNRIDQLFTLVESLAATIVANGVNGVNVGDDKTRET